MVPRGLCWVLWPSQGTWLAETGMGFLFGPGTEPFVSGCKHELRGFLGESSLLAVFGKVKTCGHFWGAQDRGCVVTPGCDGGDIPAGQLWAGMKVTCWRGGEAPGGHFGSCCVLSGCSEPVVRWGHHWLIPHQLHHWE